MGANKKIAGLLADMNEFLADEMVRMEGNTGFTGHESEEDLEDESDAPILAEMKGMLSLRTRIAELASEMGIILPAPEADKPFG